MKYFRTKFSTVKLVTINLAKKIKNIKFFQKEKAKLSSFIFTEKLKEKKCQTFQNRWKWIRKKIKQILINIFHSLNVIRKLIKAYIENPNLKLGIAVGCVLVITFSTNIRQVIAVDEIQSQKGSWYQYFVDTGKSLVSIKLWKSYIYKKQLSSQKILPILIFGSGILIGATGTVFSNYLFNQYQPMLLEESMTNLLNLYHVLENDLASMTLRFTQAKSLHFKCWEDNKHMLEVLKMAAKIVSKYDPNLKIYVPPVLDFPNYDDFTLTKNFKN